MFISLNATGSLLLRNWRGHNGRASQAMERLSSGLRINRAADDPSGMAISRRMRMQLDALKAGQDTVAQGLSATEIADGAMNELQDLAQRMRELAVRAGNETLGADERQRLDAEYQQLLDELDRIGQSTSLNDLYLLKTQPAGDAPGKTLTVEVDDLSPYLDALDEYLLQINRAAGLGETGALAGLGIAQDGRTDTQRLADAVLGFTREQLQTLQQSGAAAGGRYRLQVGPEGVCVSIRGIDRQSLGLAGTSLATASDAAHALDALDDALQELSLRRGSLGADQNRLEHTTRSLATMEENLAASLSRIEDADMAAEMVEWTKAQALAQVSAFLMAQQKNQEPEQILRLIQSM